MPTPRRNISLLVQDAAGTLPAMRRRERFALPSRRCASPGCRCVLARDNTQSYCSPCQRRINGVPDNLSLYLPVKPIP